MRWIATAAGTAQKKRGTQLFSVVANSANPLLLPQWSSNILGKTDEFMPPLIFFYANEQRVRDGDVVLFFNFRADRARQLSQAFLLKNFDGFDREVWPQVEFVTLTQYDVTYSSPFIFVPEKLADILG